MVDWALATKQERSKKSAARFVDALEELLRESPFATITVEAIVEKSGMSVGAFYKRFRDKKALLQLFDERLVENLYASLDRDLDPVRLENHTLYEVLKQFFTWQAKTIIDNAPYFRTIRAEFRVKNDPAFLERNRECNLRIQKRFVQLLTQHRKSISHQDWKSAASMALDLADASMTHVLLYGRMVQDSQATEPPSATKLARALTHMVWAYLTTEKPS